MAHRTRFIDTAASLVMKRPSRETFPKSTAATRLFELLKDGNRTEFDTLLQDASLHDLNDEVLKNQYQTILHVAAGAGRIDAMKALLAKGMSVDQPSLVDPGTGCSVTPLMAAAHNSRHAAVSFLLSRGADPAILDKHGRNFVVYAKETDVGILRLGKLFHVEEVSAFRVLRGYIKPVPLADTSGEAEPEPVWVDPLDRRCARVLAIIPEITKFRAWRATEERLTTSLQAALDATPARDFVEISSLRLLLNEHQRDKRLLALSEEAECAAVRTEYDAVVQEVTQRCEELLDSGSVSMLRRVGERLNKLQALKP